MRRFLKVGIIEIVILLVIILGVCGILVFYKVPPFSSLYDYIPFLPKEPTVTRGYLDESRVVKYSPVVPTVSAQSEVEGFTVEVINEEDLITLLNEWKFFGRPYTDSNLGTTGDKPLANLTFILTATQQPGNQIATTDGDVYLSSNFLVNPNQGEVLVHVGESVLNNTKQDPSLAFQAEAIMTLYRLTHPATSNIEIQTREENVTKLLQELVAQNKIYFVVEKEE